jgi:hypothetical protein
MPLLHLTLDQSLPTQFQHACTVCGTQMTLRSILPDKAEQDEHAFACQKCTRPEILVVDCGYARPSLPFLATLVDR